MENGINKRFAKVPRKKKATNILPIRENSLCALLICINQTRHFCGM